MCLTWGPFLPLTSVCDYLRHRVHFHSWLVCLSLSQTVRRATPIVWCPVICLYINIAEQIFSGLMNLAFTDDVSHWPKLFLLRDCLFFFQQPQSLYICLILSDVGVMRGECIAYFHRRKVETLTPGCRCSWPRCHIQISPTLALISLVLKCSICVSLFR